VAGRASEIDIGAIESEQEGRCGEMCEKTRSERQRRPPAGIKISRFQSVLPGANCCNHMHTGHAYVGCEYPASVKMGKGGVGLYQFAQPGLFRRPNYAGGRPTQPNTHPLSRVSYQQQLISH
jgi:hypothetical protein